MSRLASQTVPDGFDAAWFFAAWPTSRVPSEAENATHDGVVLPPSAFGMTSTLPAPGRTTATHE